MEDTPLYVHHGTAPESFFRRHAPSTVCRHDTARHDRPRTRERTRDGPPTGCEIPVSKRSISRFAVRLRPDHPRKEGSMKYVMLIYQGDALERQAALPEEEQKQVYAEYQGINETPGVTPGLPMGLPENATTVRVEGGKTLTTDGPYVGMKEAVGGLFVLEADDLDAAIEVAARVPAARYGGAVEIRPSEVYWQT
jgi:hypothetical protein